MVERIYLVGAEEVSSAASRISSAANDMRSAAATLDNVLYQQRQFLDDWLTRLEQILKENSK